MSTLNLKMFQEMRKTPLPELETYRETRLRRDGYPLDENHPGYQEQLIDIKTLRIAGENQYHSSWNPPYYRSIPGSIPDLVARKTVAEKLVAVNEKLASLDLELYIFDLFRPQAVQNYFFYEWFPHYLRERYPENSEEWIQQEVRKYWSEGLKTKAHLKKTIPPHSTGGAVDLSLRHKKTGLLLEFGSIFDDVRKVSHPDYFEKKTKNHVLTFTEEEALANRRFLFYLMEEFGFAFHPTEWWHFSYGDQMWALFKKEKTAIYGYAGHMYGEELPDE